MEYILETNSLSKIYGRNKALDNVSIHVPKGGIYGLIGRNGAGKTTLLKIISSLATASSGEYKIFGKLSSELKGDNVKIGTLIEAPGIYPKLSAVDNMQIKSLTMGINDKQRINDLLKLVGLDGVMKKPVGKFSLGMKQRLGMAMALIGKPELVILDEPINGLDPQGIIEVRDTISKLNREHNITFIISSHILEELSKVATVYGIIDKGVLLEEITTDALMNRCTDKIQIGTNDNEKACRIIKEFGISDFRLSDDGFIYIFEQTDKCADINFALAKEGVPVHHLSKCSESIENYYINLTDRNGGNKNA